MTFPASRFFFLVPLALSLAGCGKKPDATDAAVASESASLAVTLAHAERKPIQRSLIASGPVTAWEEMQLGVELSGLRVTALHVDVGQAVHKGQVLLEIDHQTLDSDLRQAQAAASEAEAGVQLAKVNLWRGQEMAKSQLISASALDNLKAALVQAQARAATTDAQRDGVQMRRNFADLRAPDDGVISKRMVQPGQVVMAGAELLRLIRQGRLEWRPELPEADLAKVAIGDPVNLRDANGQTVTGRVRAVSPGVDSTTRTGTIYADLPQPGALKAGTFVEGRIITSVSDGLLVPSSSVVTRDGYAYVFTVDDSKVAHRVRVTVGSTQDDQIEVLTGLKPGDAVVATGAGFLGDGDKVRVVATNAASVANRAGVAP